MQAKLVHDKAKVLNTDMRRAAFLLALERIEAELK
jgi:hypothetical protein